MTGFLWLMAAFGGHITVINNPCQYLVQTRQAVAQECVHPIQVLLCMYLCIAAIQVVRNAVGVKIP